MIGKRKTLILVHPLAGYKLKKGKWECVSVCVQMRVLLPNMGALRFLSDLTHSVIGYKITIFSGDYFIFFDLSA